MKKTNVRKTTEAMITDYSYTMYESAIILATAEKLSTPKVVKKFPKLISAATRKYIKNINRPKEMTDEDLQNFTLYIGQRIVFDVMCAISNTGVLKHFNKFHDNYGKYVDLEVLRDIENRVRLLMALNMKNSYFKIKTKLIECDM